MTTGPKAMGGRAWRQMSNCPYPTWTSHAPRSERQSRKPLRQSQKAAKESQLRQWKSSSDLPQQMDYAAFDAPMKFIGLSWADGCQFHGASFWWRQYGALQSPFPIFNQGSRNGKKAQDRIASASVGIELRQLSGLDLSPEFRPFPMAIGNLA